MERSRRRASGWLFFLLFCSATAAVAYHYRDRIREILPTQTSQGQSVADLAAATHLVAMGDLTVSVLESGTIQAVKSIQIASEVEGQSRIISIVPEGSMVKENDLLVELDSSGFEDQINQPEITVQSARASLTEAEENLKIQRNQNESNIKTAELKIKFARVDLTKYLEGDWPQQKRSAEAEITIAEEELKRANDRVKWTQKLEKEGFVTRSELEADALAVKKAELKLEEKRESLHILQKYEYPKKKEVLEADVEEAEQEFGRVKHKASAQILQEEANLRAREATYELQARKLEKLKEQKAKCRILAPAAGLVVYYAESNRWRSAESAIEEGAMLRERQKIITLPDISGMRVDIKVHETAVDKVHPEQRAFVSIDALPDKRFVGHVKSVAPVPDSQSSWLNPDLKVYSTEILIDSDATMLKPGMSASVEIIVAELKDVTKVPMQSVVSQQGQTCCYVSKGGRIELRAVRIGLANNEYIVVEEGLEPGERVLLYAPEPAAKVVKVGFDRVSSATETVSLAPRSEEARAPGTERADETVSADPAGPQPSTDDKAREGGEDRESRRKRFQNMTPEEREAARKRMEERMKNMTPEEREQMRKRFRGNRGQRAETRDQ